jgi:hypothetical protein
MVFISNYSSFMTCDTVLEGTENNLNQIKLRFEVQLRMKFQHFNYTVEL